MEPTYLELDDARQTAEFEAHVVLVLHGQHSAMCLLVLKFRG